MAIRKITISIDEDGGAYMELDGLDKTEATLALIETVDVLLDGFVMEDKARMN